jgi:hypothetical protein
LQPSTDPEIEQFEQFWANISRLVYSRKRRPLQDASQTPVPTTKLKEEVENNLRRLMLNGAKLIPGVKINSEPQHLQRSQTNPLNLEALTNEKLLEINQQQERFGRTASQRRPSPTAAQFQRTDPLSAQYQPSDHVSAQYQKTDYFSGPSRAWTIESESDLHVFDLAPHPRSPTLPSIQNGILYVLLVPLSVLSNKP